MEGNRGDCVAAEHVKTEAADENAPAPVAGSQDPAAPCGGTACGGGGGGEDGQAAEGQQAAASSAPVLLCELFIVCCVCFPPNIVVHTTLFMYVYLILKILLSFPLRFREHRALFCAWGREIVPEDRSR